MATASGVGGATQGSTGYSSVTASSTGTGTGTGTGSSSSGSSSSSSASSGSSSSSTGGGWPGFGCGSTPDPLTGQACPLYSACMSGSDCGMNTGCTIWTCDAGKCGFLASSSCVTTKGDVCAANVVIEQRVDPPFDKTFLTPDNVDFREAATLSVRVSNFTTDDLYLDYIPVELELMGFASQFDIGSVKVYEDLGSSDKDAGDFLVASTPNGYPSNDKVGPCGGSSASRVPKNGGSKRFLVTLAFLKEKTFIGGRSYRLALKSNLGWQFRVGSTLGPQFAGTVCGVPAGGLSGAWLTAVDP